MINSALGLLFVKGLIKCITKCIILAHTQKEALLLKIEFG